MTDHLAILRQLFVMLALPLVISACAIREYPNPDSIVLQRPSSGQALIYFFRAPHDSGPLAIEIDGKRVATLRPETYVALSLPPGRYRFLTKGGLFDGGEAAEPLEVSLKANERVFYHVSGIDEKRVGLVGVMIIQGAGAVPLLGKESVVRNRTWKECSELDARGLATISRLVAPEN